MGDDFILGAQWTSYDNGLTWERAPMRSVEPREATHMTACAVNYTRGEVTFRMDLAAVFGVPPPPVIHAIAEDNPGFIKARSICGQIVMGPDAGGKSVRYEDRGTATCPRCRQGT